MQNLSGRLAPLTLFILAFPAAGQLPGIVDYTPEEPPNVGWPELEDVAGGVGTPGTNFADTGTGRGVAWVDVVGPDPLDPTNLNRVGPSDGTLDFVQVNSNSPALPLGSKHWNWELPPIGASSSSTAVFRGEPDGRYTYVTHLMGVTPEGYDIAYPGGSPWAVLPADYDGDGDQDLFFACGGFNLSSPNALLRNDGGTFVNVSIAAGIVEDQVSFGATWLDYDRDGDLDLYVTNSVGFSGTIFQGQRGSDDPTDRLYRNNGDGTFTDVAAAAKVDLKSTGFSVAASDLDNDGWTDLVVSCFGQFNKLFYNNGDRTFSFVVPRNNRFAELDMATLMVPDPAHPGAYEYAYVPSQGIAARFPISGQRSMPVEVADMNGDGWSDVLYGVYSLQLPDANTLGAEGALYLPAERSYLYLNAGDQDGDGRGEGDFREVGELVGFDFVAGTMGMYVADFDADGYPDVYAGNGGPQLAWQLEEDLHFVNDGPSWPRDFLRRPGQRLPKTLFEVGALTGAYENILMAHGLTSARRDPEGGLELVVANGGPARLNGGQENVYYANTGRSDGRPVRTLAVDLVPDASPPGSIGSRVEILRGDFHGDVRVSVLERQSGRGFGSSTTGPLVFGLDRSVPLYARTRWTSGVRQGTLLLGTPSGPARIAEPRISLDARFVGSGLEVTLENRTGAPRRGELFLQVVRHTSRGGFPAPGLGFVGWHALPPQRAFPSAVAVGPSASWNTSLSVPGASTPGLFRILWVDDSTGQCLAENGVWYEPNPVQASARRPLAEPHARWTSEQRASEEAPSAAKPVLHFRSTLTLEAGSLVATSYTSSGPVRLLPVEQMGFPGGAELQRVREHVDLTLPEDGLATVTFQDGDVVIALGAPAICCDEAPSREMTTLRFSDLRGKIFVDGVRYSSSGERFTP